MPPCPAVGWRHREVDGRESAWAMTSPPRQHHCYALAMSQRLTGEDLAALRHWLHARRARRADDPERRDALAALARASIDSMQRVAAVNELLHLHDRRVAQLEAVVEVLLASQLEDDPGEQAAAPEPPRDHPYRGSSVAAPELGTFTCRSCGRVLPSEEACTNGEGRYCVDCFDMDR